MKKLTHFLTVALASIAACATSFAQSTATFSPATVTGSTTAGEQSVSVDAVTIKCNNGVFNDAEYRFYKSSNTEISVSSGKIERIEFTCTASGDAKYGPGSVTASTGDYAYEGKVGTWTGSAGSVTFTASKNQMRATAITVTYSTTGKLSASLSFSEKSIAIEQNITSFTAPSFTKATTADVVFSSSDEAVATVSADGQISLNGGVGTAVITAKSDENDKYAAGEATCNITVTAERARETCVMATEIKSGAKYIISTIDGEEILFATTLPEAKTYGYLSVEAAIANGDAIRTVKGNEFTFTEKDGHYTITDSYGRKIWRSEKYTSFQAGGDNADGKGETWDITLNADGSADIVNVDYQATILFSAKYSSFGCYTDTESGTVPYIYEVKSSTPTAISPIGGNNPTADEPAFNIRGQRVRDSFRGIVIRGGRMTINRRP